MLTDEEIDKLKATKNENEWNAVCDEIKKTHNGYPVDWFAKVVSSGILDAQATSWVIRKR